MIYLITYLSVVLYLLFIVFIISGLFKHKSPKISLSKDLPLVSVVIAARNEEKNLPDLIYDLVNQEYPLDKLEVIFVNDRSKDLTNRLLNEASDDYSFINHIVIEELSHKMTPKKYALTKGIESAKGEIIISTDADCRVGKFWVSSMTYDVIRCGDISIGFSTISDKSFFDEYLKIEKFYPVKGTKYAFIFGNEVDGVSDDIINVSDEVIEIPQVGTKHSLNVSVAAGIVLWDFFYKTEL